ncbi:MAG: LysM peptidoglycan-binding domain-containing protein [Anaerolineae bacterium]
MPSRIRPTEVLLLALAVLGPIVHLLGVLVRGPALLYEDASRLGVIYAALAISAAVGAYLALKRGTLPVRLFAAAALLANLGSIAFVANTWWRDMRGSIAEAAMEPIEEGTIGILISTASGRPMASAELNALEDAINERLEQAGLGRAVTVQRTYAIVSEGQAQRVGQRLGASVVVWRVDGGDELAVEEYHVTYLGGNPQGIGMVPADLMLLLALRGDVAVQRTIAPEDNGISPLAVNVIAPAAAGFGSLAAGNPAAAASQFQSAITAGGVATGTLGLLHGYLGNTYLVAERPDLALEQFTLATTMTTDSRGWVGIGNTGLQQEDWVAAEAAYRKAVAASPYDPIGYCGLGVIFTEQRNTARAIATLRQAVNLEPEWGIPYALLGLAYELESDIESARACYQMCANYSGTAPVLQALVAERANEILRNPPTAVPTATPVPTPTATPLPASGVHTVAEGDTLKAIADQYGTTVERLVELNKLEDPNDLFVGQVLIVPDEFETIMQQDDED